MSSHREAPEISKDPVADSTDLYAFVSPDRPNTVTLISNYIPLEEPARRSQLLRVRRRCPVRNPYRQRRGCPRRHHLPVPLPDAGRATPIRSSTIPALSPRSTARLEPAPVLLGHQGAGERSATSAGQRAGLPAVQHRAALHAELRALAQAAVHDLPSGETVFAGQRLEGFYVDLGAVFDLGDLRPFQNLHLIPSAPRSASIRQNARTYTASPSRCPKTT